MSRRHSRNYRNAYEGLRVLYREGFRRYGFFVEIFLKKLLFFTLLSGVKEIFSVFADIPPVKEKRGAVHERHGGHRKIRKLPQKCLGYQNSGCCKKAKYNLSEENEAGFFK